MGLRTTLCVNIFRNSETTVGFHEVSKDIWNASEATVEPCQGHKQQWPQIRSDFVLERKKNKEEEAVSHVTEEPAVEESILRKNKNLNKK